MRTSGTHIREKRRGSREITTAKTVREPKIRIIRELGRPQTVVFEMIREERPGSHGGEQMRQRSQADCILKTNHWAMKSTIQKQANKHSDQCHTK